MTERDEEVFGSLEDYMTTDSYTEDNEFCIVVRRDDKIGKKIESLYEDGHDFAAFVSELYDNELDMEINISTGYYNICGSIDKFDSEDLFERVKKTFKDLADSSEFYKKKIFEGE